MLYTVSPRFPSFWLGSANGRTSIPTSQASQRSRDFPEEIQYFIWGSSKSRSCNTNLNARCLFGRWSPETVVGKWGGEPENKHKGVYIKQVTLMGNWSLISWEKSWKRWRRIWCWGLSHLKDGSWGIYHRFPSVTGRGPARDSVRGDVKMKGL